MSPVSIFASRSPATGGVTACANRQTRSPCSCSRSARAGGSSTPRSCRKYLLVAPERGLRESEFSAEGPERQHARAVRDVVPFAEVDLVEVNLTGHAVQHGRSVGVVAKVSRFMTGRFAESLKKQALALSANDP